MIANTHDPAAAHAAQALNPPSLRMSMMPPTPSPAHRVRLTPAGPALWRVQGAAGRIIGHLQGLEHPLGTRWGARRYHDRVVGFLTLGEFWAVDDAVAALRLG